tara:strand:+ start:446 stop:664 length:219 start_codon:yes stop_codon:yes gene_type:complete
MALQNFFSGYHLEVTKFDTEVRKEKNCTYYISGDGVKLHLFIENAGKYVIGYWFSAPFDLSKMAIARIVMEQ